MIILNQEIQEQLALFAARLSCNKGCFSECDYNHDFTYEKEDATALRDVLDCFDYIQSILNAIMLGEVELATIQNAKSIAELYDLVYYGGRSE